jgi:hypothetical protein
LLFSNTPSSKALLLAYLESPAVISVVGSTGSDNILNFLRNNVFPHEDNFAAYHYHLVRSFDEYSNTPLEGTNCGLKYNSQAVVPSMDVAKAGKVMMDQDATKAANRKRSASAAFHRTPLHTTTATSRQLKPVAEGMLQQQLSLIESFASVRTSENNWLIVFSANRVQNISLPGESSMEESIAPPSLGLYPVFERVRSVMLDDEGRLSCSCGYMERNGAPCRHVSHVAYKYGNSFVAFSHHDVAVRFWSCYDQFVAIEDSATLDEDKRDIRNNLWQARCCQPVGGAYVKGGIRLYQRTDPQYIVGVKSTATWQSMDAIAVSAYFTLCLREKFKVANYSCFEVESALAAMAAKSIHAVGMTQETYHADSDGHCEINFQEMNDADFSAWEIGKARTTTAHDILAPRMKELASIYENMPHMLVPLTAVLDEHIQRGKAMNAALQPKPVGRVVSSIVPNGCVQHSHSRQNPI